MFNFNKENKIEILDAEFDIENVNVLSIERSCDEQTLITIRVSETETDEFYLICSPEKHNDLVMRFRKKLGLV